MIELVVGLSIGAFLFTMALTATRTLGTSTALDRAAAVVVGQLRQARRHALHREVVVGVFIDQAADTMVVFEDDPRGGLAAGWDSGDLVLTQRRLPAGIRFGRAEGVPPLTDPPSDDDDGVTCESAPGRDDDVIVFSARGRRSGAACVLYLYSEALAGAAPEGVPPPHRAIVIAASGMARVYTFDPNRSGDSSLGRDAAWR